MLSNAAAALFSQCLNRPPFSPDHPSGRRVIRRPADRQAHPTVPYTGPRSLLLLMELKRLLMLPLLILCADTSYATTAAAAAISAAISAAITTPVPIPIPVAALPFIAAVTIARPSTLLPAVGVGVVLVRPPRQVVVGGGSRHAGGAVRALPPDTRQECWRVDDACACVWVGVM